ncbi:PIN domain-containing protein [Symplocastrum sp. BBK-W-15]|uniref:PIN domain-containing protein n=2 Tax=Limnofasciculus TaxID=3064905 RepID=A0AAE3GR43_9CYAN|nr:PIN domain-containing protein [Limnofasciculus baicalensis BBK-W-15]
MAIAKGQDEAAPEFLINPPSDICLMIPSICYMEAIVAFQNEQKRRKTFQQNINNEISESKRNLSSSLGSLVNDLEKARLACDQLFNEFEGQFLDAITLVRTKVTSIDLPLNSLTATLTDPILKEEKQLRDNLILQCILDHAQRHPTQIKVLLSGNYKEFGKVEVQDSLKQLGIIKYFTNTKNLLGWLGNKNISDVE